MKDTAVIFPGQGAQIVGMGADVAQEYDAARAVFDEADQVLGFSLSKLCFEGPAEELEKTDIQQPAIFVTSVAIWSALYGKGHTLEGYGATGGLSLGEYTALHLAGAFDFASSLRLVRKRGELMQAAAEASPSGMVSLIGADEESATKLCEHVAQGEVLAPANFNCPGQIVISGHQTACDRAVEAASEFECRAVALPVAGAFHSPLMQPAADELRSVLAETEISLPVIPVYANVTANPHEGVEQIRESLARQVTSPVLWQRCVEGMRSDGIGNFMEVGPGRVLAGMMRKIERRMPMTSINSAESVASMAASAS
ncbi:MAG: ACP S-malonyltransferase [Phycisphaerae bacterium]